MTILYPIILEPAFKDYLWGGQKLRTDFNKKCDYEKIAESWELSCHKDGTSTVVNGEYAGKTLTEYIDINGKKVLGTNCDKFEYFPILIKLIDAKDNLSVQVHPDNEYALRVEGEYGKTEMWYVVDCEEGASLIYGVKEEISKEEFASRIKDNTLLDVANVVPVKKGDVFFIKSGTLHAIGKGILIAEIQQNSNTTYRVYDYGRLGVDGKPRALHIDKAIDVTNLTPTPLTKNYKQEIYKDYKKIMLSTCEYFTCEEYNLNGNLSMTADNSSFNSILVLDGNGTLSYGDTSLDLVKGLSVFIPAGMGEYTLNGDMSFIFTKI